MNQRQVEFDNLVAECGEASACKPAEIVRQFLVRAYEMGTADAMSGRIIPTGPHSTHGGTRSFPMSTNPPAE